MRDVGDRLIVCGFGKGMLSCRKYARHLSLKNWIALCEWIASCLNNSRGLISDVILLFMAIPRSIIVRPLYLSLRTTQIGRLLDLLVWHLLRQSNHTWSRR